MTDKNNIFKRKIVISSVLVVVVVALSALIVISTTSIASVKAFPPFIEKDEIKVNGTIKVEETVKNYIKDSIKIPFESAASTAAKQIINGSIIGGHIDGMSGFLVYKFMVVNPENETLYKVIVDPGNGQVLYTSDGMSKKQFQGFGQHGPWFGPHMKNEKPWFN